MDFIILVFSLLKAKTSFLFYFITNKQKQVRRIKQAFPKSHVSIPPWGRKTSSKTVILKIWKLARIEEIMAIHNRN